MCVCVCVCVCVGVCGCVGMRVQSAQLFFPNSLVSIPATRCLTRAEHVNYHKIDQHLQVCASKLAPTSSLSPIAQVLGVPSSFTSVSSPSEASRLW